MVGVHLLLSLPVLSFPSIMDPRIPRLTNWLSVNGATLGPIEIGKSKIGDGL